MTIQGQVAIITGASQGIGEATAEALAKQGIHLVLAARNKEKLKAIFERLSQQYPLQKFIVEQCDIQNAADVQSVVDSAIKEFGKIDILVNNAGVAPKMGLLQEHSIEAIDKTIDTNLKGPAYAMRAVLPHMAVKGQGTIININSIAGKSAFPFWSVYDATKFGLHALTEAVAEEQRSNGIRVVGIYPGAVDTAIWDNIDTQGQGPDRTGMLTPAQVAEAVVYVINQPPHVFVSDITLMPLKPAL